MNRDPSLVDKDDAIFEKGVHAGREDELRRVTDLINKFVDQEGYVDDELTILFKKIRGERR